MAYQAQRSSLKLAKSWIKWWNVYILKLILFWLGRSKSFMGATVNIEKWIYKNFPLYQIRCCGIHKVQKNVPVLISHRLFLPGGIHLAFSNYFYYFPRNLFFKKIIQQNLVFSSMVKINMFSIWT